MMLFGFPVVIFVAAVWDEGLGDLEGTHNTNGSLIAYKV